MDTPQVWIACLHCYNCGRIHGTWFDADGTLSDEVEAYFMEKEGEDKSKMKCGGEELVVHDSQNFGFSLGEVGVTEAQEIGEFLEEYGEKGSMALSHFCGRLDEAKNACDENYRGEYSSLEDYARESIGISETEIEKVLGNLAQYIDWQRYAEDLDNGGEIWTERDESGNVHVFSES